MKSKIEDFYIDVMNCAYKKNECPKAWNIFSIGLVLRAFSICKSSIVKIFVVGKNPGHPLNGETIYYKNKKRSEFINS